MNKATISEAIMLAIRERQEELCVGNVTRNQGVGFDTFSPECVEAVVKTARDGYDCCGVEWPNEEAMFAARKIAACYSLCVKFEECEKGWGSFVFYDDGTPGEELREGDGHV